ncbi:MAG: hypothetical protein J7L63_02260, partial [Thermoplasmata archaeon]|nr:hypothetical protein [Thermoplasmata archaeon]
FMTIIVSILIIIFFEILHILNFKIMVEIILLSFLIGGGTYYLFKSVDRWDLPLMIYIDDKEFSVNIRKDNTIFRHVIGPIKWEKIMQISIDCKKVKIYYSKKGGEYVANFLIKALFMSKEERQKRQKIANEIIKRVREKNPGVKIVDKRKSICG